MSSRGLSTIKLSELSVGNFLESLTGTRENSVSKLMALWTSRLPLRSLMMIDIQLPRLRAHSKEPHKKMMSLKMPVCLVTKRKNLRNDKPTWTSRMQPKDQLFSVKRVSLLHKET